jgi:hypothetical protein
VTTSYATSLPTEARRALARAELKRRGLRVDHEDPALTAAFVALRAGVPTLPGYRWFDESVCALADRIDAGTLSPTRERDNALGPHVDQGAILPAGCFEHATGEQLQRFDLAQELLREHLQIPRHRRQAQGVVLGEQAPGFGFCVGHGATLKNSTTGALTLPPCACRIPTRSRQDPMARKGTGWPPVG